MPTLISTVLGSCVAVALWDKKREYGGMNHFLFPLTRNPGEATARYGNVAVTALVRLFLEEGSERKNLEGQIFGGAHPAESPGEVMEICRRNVDVSRRILMKNKIPIVSEDVGGTRGRKVVYNTLTNDVAVFRVERLRESDWYPYKGSR
jgi:chemotaxis protein CheD